MATRSGASCQPGTRALGVTGTHDKGSIRWYSPTMADTTIKISEEVRDHLREVAEERGISTRALVEALSASLQTQAERHAALERNIRTARERLGVELTPQDIAATRNRLAELREQARSRAA